MRIGFTLLRSISSRSVCYCNLIVSRVPNESPELQYDQLTCRADLSAELGSRKLRYDEGFNSNAPRCVGSR